MDTLYTFGDSITHSKNNSVHFLGLLNSATPRPSIYPLLDPKCPLFGAIYPYLRAQGGSWLRYNPDQSQSSEGFEGRGIWALGPGSGGTLKGSLKGSIRVP